MDVKCWPDKFGGMEMHAQPITEGSEAYTSEQLAADLARWRTEGMRGVWLHIHIQHGHEDAAARLLGSAMAFGFTPHHTTCGAQSDVQARITLTHWLGEGQSRIPQQASHSVSAAGAVITDSGHVLLVRGRHGPDGNPTGWILPGGVVQPGEFWRPAVQREVRQEAGVDAQFKQWLMLQHQPTYRFGASDVYMVALMQLPGVQRAVQLPTIRKDDDEILHASWWPISEVLTSPEIQRQTKSVVALAAQTLVLEQARAAGPASGWRALLPGALLGAACGAMAVLAARTPGKQALAWAVAAGAVAALGAARCGPGSQATCAPVAPAPGLAIVSSSLSGQHEPDTLVSAADLLWAEPGEALFATPLHGILRTGLIRQIAAGQSIAETARRACWLRG